MKVKGLNNLWMPEMKNTFVLMLLFLMMLIVVQPKSLSAQDVPFKKEFYFGVKGGMVFSRVRFKPNVEQNMFNGNTAGLLFRMISEPHIGIQVEVNYLQKGWEEKPLTGSAQNYFHKLNYAEIPIMTHANLGNGALRFVLNVGPSVAFLRSESQGMMPGNSAIAADPPISYWGKAVDSKIDFLFVGGIGTEYHFKRRGALGLDARIFYSLTNLYDSKTSGYDPSQTNGAQITLSYLFWSSVKK